MKLQEGRVTRQTPGASGLAGPSFRADIQGLRAVAVLLVLMYHVWPGVLPGGYVGVDVFFVISGYLITGLLLREHDQTGRISMLRFYARRLRRLLPAATVTLAAVAAGSFLLLPDVYWRSIAIEVVASALYVENWWLASQAVDYLAEGESASPLQHYWSLSIEEQFYIVWPWLVAGAAWMGARAGRSTRGRVAGAVGVLVAASLAHSIWFTRQEPGIAYFATTTRVWELGLGALLATATWRPSAPVGKALGFGGLALVIAAGLVLDADTLFPGAAALLPTLGAAMVIAAGGGRSGMDAALLLESRPARFLGDISYSLYLWHWPLIVFYLHLTERNPGLWSGTALVLVSMVVATLSRKLVEEPALRMGKQQRTLAGAYVLGGVCVAASVGLGSVLYVGAAGDEGAGDQTVDVDPAPGATAMQPGYRPPFTPSLKEARRDRPDVGMKCHGRLRDSEPNLACVLGGADAEYDLVLVGDSHAWHLVPAFVELLEPLDARLHLMTKSACPFTLATLSRDRKPYQECRAWNERVLAYIKEVRPDAVISGASANVAALREPGESSPELVARGFLPLWEEVREAGAEVLVLRDTPRFSGPGGDPVRCLARKQGRAADCVVGRSDAVKSEDEDPALIAASMAPDARLIDITDSICNPHACDPVVGGVLVLRDSHHLTATFARSLAPVLGAQIEPHLPAHE